jgi:hypothetical protein
MQSLLATSLLAGCVVQAVADTPKTTDVDAAAANFSSKTNNNNKNNKQDRHRLLQKFMKRKESTNNANVETDIGILANNNTPRRFLQEQEYDYYCPRDTCPTELCDCADGGGSLEDCTAELQSVCKAGRLGDCVFQDYIQVYQEVYCPFVSCVDGGFRENQCDCAFYELYCDRLTSDECSSGVTGISANDPDKTLFFGCDAEQVANVCDQAKACKERGDLQGLDLGTWEGSVTTGTLEKSGSGKKFREGGNILVGVSLLSMLWLMVNI